MNVAPKMLKKLSNMRIYMEKLCQIKEAEEILGDHPKTIQGLERESLT